MTLEGLSRVCAKLEQAALKILGERNWREDE